MTVPAIRRRMVAMLRNVDETLAARVADGLGLELPDPLPPLLENPTAPEVTESPALSLTAIPGETGVRSRKVAILVADGADTESLMSLHAALTAAGAIPRFVGVRLGTVQSANGEAIDADASMENSPDVLFDALVLPHGEDAVTALRASGRTTEFITNQYRHCKTILALGASAKLLEPAGVHPTLADGVVDPGIIIAAPEDDVAPKLIESMTRHRHFERESDPPRV